MLDKGLDDKMRTWTIVMDRRGSFFERVVVSVSITTPLAVSCLRNGLRPWPRALADKFRSRMTVRRYSTWFGVCLVLKECASVVDRSQL